VVTVLASTGDDEANRKPIGPIALDRASVEVALRAGDVVPIVAALKHLRGGDENASVTWLSTRTEEDGQRRFPHAERLGRWLSDVDAALEQGGPADPLAFGEQLIRSNAQGKDAGPDAPLDDDDRSLIADLQAGRVSVSRLLDSLATRGAGASELEVAIARGRGRLDR